MMVVRLSTGRMRILVAVEAAGIDIAAAGTQKPAVGAAVLEELAIDSVPLHSPQMEDTVAAAACCNDCRPKDLRQEHHHHQQLQRLRYRNNCRFAEPELELEVIELELELESEIDSVPHLHPMMRHPYSHQKELLQHPSSSPHRLRHTALACSVVLHTAM